MVTILTDIHQINDGYGIPRLVDWFEPNTHVSSAIVPVLRYKKDGEFVSETSFIIYYSCRDPTERVCKAESDALIFRKSSAGGNLLNLRPKDIRMAIAAIKLYVTIFYCASTNTEWSAASETLFLKLTGTTWY
jgi:hypothetical protein